MRVALVSAKNRLATGVDRYAQELGAALRAIGADARDVVIERREAKLGPLRLGGNASIWLARLRRRRGDADVLHALDPAVATRDADVVTIHDLLAEEFPELLLPTRSARLDWAMTRRAALHVGRFITPSEATRQALVARWGVAPERVTAIHHGIDHARFRPTVERSPLVAGGKPTLVYVGDDNPRKNVALAIEALAHAKLDARLVRVGPSRFPEVHEAYRRRAREAGVDLVEPGYLADDAIVPLLAHASAFLWPTRGEGFGFPPLEAMACGAPVVALDTTVNREVCGPLARYHADDAAACAEGIQEVLRHPPSTEALTAYARQFNWDAAARKALAVYEEVARP